MGIMERSDYPGRGVKPRKIDLAAASPGGLHPRHNDQMVVEQEFNVHIISNIVPGEWRHAPFQVEVVFALTQPGIGGNRDFADAQDHFWIGFRKLLNQLEQERGQSSRWTADPYLTDRRVGQSLDVVDASPQFIEYGSPARQQGPSVLSRLHAPPAAGQ